MQKASARRRLWCLPLLLLLLVLLLLCSSPAVAQAGDDLSISDADDIEEDSDTTGDTSSSIPSGHPDDATPIIPQPPPPVDTDPALPHLLSYLASHNVDTSAVRFTESHRGRGLDAARDLPADATILSLPSSVLVTADYVKAKSQLAALMPDANLIDAMAAWLAYNRNNTQSVHRPYLATLPPFVPLPIWYSPAMAEGYKGTFLEELASSRRGIAYSTYNRFSPDVRHHVSREAFLWGLTILWSRAFSMAVRDPQEESGWRSVAVLVPLADMLNTGNDTEINVRCKTGKQGKSFDCKTIRPIQAGEELLVSYGPRSDAQLLHDYGFAFGSNPHNFAMIELPSPKTNKTKTDIHRVAFRKIEVEDQLVRESGRKEPELHFKLTVPTDWSQLSTLVPKDVMGWARLNVIGQQETANLTAYDMIHRMRAGEPFSKRTDHLAYKLVNKFIRRALRRYPTSAEHDYALLNNETSELRGNLPLLGMTVVRWGEKALLHDISAVITRELPRLQHEAELEREERRRDFEHRQQEKKAREEREREKKLQKERERREEEARLEAMRKGLHGNDEPDDDDFSAWGAAGADKHSEGLRKAMAGQRGGHDELRRA